MTIRLYFDEDSMYLGLIRALRARGVDVTTALEAGMIERSDVDHLEYATRQGRALCTFNVGDLHRIHTEYALHGKTHCGIILMRQQRYSIGEQMRRLLRIVANKSADDMETRVEFLSDWN